MRPRELIDATNATLLRLLERKGFVQERVPLAGRPVALLAWTAYRICWPSQGRFSRRNERFGPLRVARGGEATVNGPRAGDSAS